MAIKEVENFYILVKKDPQLREELKKIKNKFTSGKLSPLNAEKFIELGMIPLAQKYGITFSLDDLMDYTAKNHAIEIKTHKESLSSDDLEAVGGGKSSFDINIFIAAKIMTDIL